MKSSPFAHRVFAIALTLSLAMPAFAGAPTDADRATARELGASGLAALDAKDYATAFDRLSRAVTLYDAPTLRLGEARALRGMGRLVSASENYRAILLRAPQPNDPAAFQQATRDAKRELPEVEAGIAHLTVSLSAAPAALRVDGVEWPAAAIGVPRPLDPGEHLIEAFTSSLQVQSQRVTLSAGQSARIEMTLPAPKAENQAGVPPVGTPPPLVSVAPSAQSSGSVQSPTPSSAGSKHTAAYVTGAVAGALALGAVVTGVLALGKKSDYDDRNNPSVARAEKEDLRSQASTMALVSTVLTGAALVGTGLTVYFVVAPRSSDSAGATNPALAGVVSYTASF